MAKYLIPRPPIHIGEIMELEIIAHIIRIIFSAYGYKMAVKNGNEIHIVYKGRPEVTMKLF